jgi:hypothetical protein
MAKTRNAVFLMGMLLAQAAGAAGFKYDCQISQFLDSFTDERIWQSSRTTYIRARDFESELQKEIPFPGTDGVDITLFLNFREKVLNRQEDPVSGVYMFISTGQRSPAHPWGSVVDQTGFDLVGPDLDLPKRFALSTLENLRKIPLRSGNLSVHVDCARVN